MEDTRITFETAKLAKEKGFPQEPNRLKIPYYNYKGEFKGDVKDWLRKYLRNEDTSDVESVSAPTQSLLAKWLREEHNIHIWVIPYTKKGRFDINPLSVPHGYRCNIYPFAKSMVYDTYEEALEIGLQEGLKLIQI